MDPGEGAGGGGGAPPPQYLQSLQGGLPGGGPPRPPPPTLFLDQNEAPGALQTIRIIWKLRSFKS